MPTTYKLGAWYSTSHFADQRIDSAGGLLASPGEHRAGAAARRRLGDLWHHRPDGVEARGDRGPGDRHLPPGHGRTGRSQFEQSVHRGRDELVGAIPPTD